MLQYYCDIAMLLQYYWNAVWKCLHVLKRYFVCYTIERSDICDKKTINNKFHKNYI